MNYINSFYKLFTKNKSSKNTFLNITSNPIPKNKRKILYKNQFLFPVFKDEYNLFKKKNNNLFKEYLEEDKEEKFYIDKENEKDFVNQDKNTLNILLLCALVKIIFFN